MKKIVYFIFFITFVSAFTFISCDDDNDNIDNKEIKPESKTLKPTSIEVVRNDDEVVANPVQNGVITLLQGEAYHITIIFDEEVELVEGNFLKFKEKSKKEYYADFYGRNLNEIVENITFKKEGFTDWHISVKQSIVIPNHYIAIKAIEGTDENSIIGDEDGLKVWLTNLKNPNYVNWYGEEYCNINVQLSFAAPVFIEEVVEGSDKVVGISKNENDTHYSLTVSTKQIRESATHDYTFVLPFYENKEGEKGEKLGEVLFIGNYAPLMQVRGGWYTRNTDVMKVNKTSDGKITDVTFSIQATKANAFIDNLNTDYFEMPLYDSNTERWSFQVKADKLKEGTNGEKVHAFDVYEGEYNGTVVQKKSGVTQKREHFLVIE